jgi:hypothetical protein
MNVVLIIAILAAFIIQGVIILGVLKMSLKWQMQVKNNTLPTVENPIKQIVEEKKLNQKLQEYQSTYDEYVNGPKEGE